MLFCRVFTISVSFFEGLTGFTSNLWKTQRNYCEINLFSPNSLRKAASPCSRLRKTSSYSPGTLYFCANSNKFFKKPGFFRLLRERTQIIRVGRWFIEVFLDFLVFSEGIHVWCVPAVELFVIFLELFEFLS